MEHTKSQQDDDAVESRLVTEADELSAGDTIQIEDEYWIAQARVLSVGDAVTDPTNRNFELEITASQGYDPENVSDWTAKPDGKLMWRIVGFNERADAGGFSGWQDITDEAVIMRVEE